MKSSERLETAPSQVVAGSLAAKDILDKLFARSNSLPDDELRQNIRNDLASGCGTHFKSVAAAAWLRSSRAGEFLETVSSAFMSLNETDRKEVAPRILLLLKQDAKFRRRGRPKGALAQGTEQQIRMVAALQVLGCSRTGMMTFLYGTEQCKETRRDAFDKFLQRHGISIEEQCEHMTEVLAFDIVKTSLTNELAEHIVDSAL